MLWLLIKKDLQRLRRNPWPWLINLALPLVITAAVGIVFGTGGKTPALAKIKVAIVDEDGSFLGSILRSALTQKDAAKYLESTLASKEEALKLIQNDQISAALVLPKKFTSKYLLGETNLVIEVIKNPAQSYYPAIVEEIAAVAVTGLNAVSQNLQSEFPVIRNAVTGKFDFAKLTQISSTIGQKVETLSDFISPPLVSYAKYQSDAEVGLNSHEFNIFALILSGMASAFLLFMADHAMRDVHRERRLRTLDRLRTLLPGISGFVASKIVFAMFTVLAGSVVLFGAGSLVFKVHWGSLWLLALTCVGYSIFAGGLLAMLVAIVNNEKRGETLNNILLFTLAFAGGSYIPANSLPRFMRESICPWMPNYWFAEAVRGFTQSNGSAPSAFGVVMKLAVAGLVLAVLANFLLKRRLSAGGR